MGENEAYCVKRGPNEDHFNRTVLMRTKYSIENLFATNVDNHCPTCILRENDCKNPDDCFDCKGVYPPAKKPTPPDAECDLGLKSC